MLQLLSMVQGVKEAVMVLATTVVFGAGCEGGCNGLVLQLLSMVQGEGEAVMV